MFINAIFIHLILLFVTVSAQIVEQDTQTESLIKPQPIEVPEKQNCSCLNNGQCYSLSFDASTVVNATKEVYCRCSNYFIGKECELEAYPVSTTKELAQKINVHNYKYFYFEPMEENMYSFGFQLCLDTKPIKATQQKIVNDTITFFLTTENQNGGIFTNEDITKPVTVTIEPDQCKTITVDYTVLSITKVKTIQKLVLALKLGQKITADPIKNDKEKDKIIDKDTLKEKVEPIKDKQTIKEVQKQVKSTDKDKDKLTHTTSIQKSDSPLTNTDILPIKNQKIVTDYHIISFTIDSTKKKTASPKEQQNLKKQNIKSINDFKSKSPSKLKQNDDSFSSRTITINFSVYPFMVEFVVFNILFSLTTLAAFIIVGIMIFVIRSRILGIRITSNFGVSSRLVNDLSHFDRYIPAEPFIKQERRQGDVSPNSSEIQCAICLVKFQSMELIRRTPCSHSFHKVCIDRWCHGMLTCPMCRKSLTQKNLGLYFNTTALELKNSPESDE